MRREAAASFAVAHMTTVTNTSQIQKSSIKSLRKDTLTAVFLHNCLNDEVLDDTALQHRNRRFPRGALDQDAVKSVTALSYQLT